MIAADQKRAQQQHRAMRDGQRVVERRAWSTLPRHPLTLPAAPADSEAVGEEAEVHLLGRRHAAAQHPAAGPEAAARVTAHPRRAVAVLRLCPRAAEQAGGSACVAGVGPQALWAWADYLAWHPRAAARGL